jgi:hypothetical protein
MSRRITKARAEGQKDNDMGMKWFHDPALYRNGTVLYKVNLKAP